MTPPKRPVQRECALPTCRRPFTAPRPTSEQAYCCKACRWQVLREAVSRHMASRTSPGPLPKRSSWQRHKAAVARAKAAKLPKPGTTWPIGALPFTSQ